MTLEYARDANGFSASPELGGSDMGDVGGLDPILYFTGAGWDEVIGTDRRLVQSLARSVPVIWVETRTSLSMAPPTRSEPAPNITRLVITQPPAAHRRLMRTLVTRAVVRAVKRFVKSAGVTPRAVLASATPPFLALTQDLPGVKVYYATDDFVDAADLWGVSADYLSRSREENLQAADLVLAISGALSRHLERPDIKPERLPNGVDLDRAFGSEVAPAAGVELVGPIAGVVGQFNHRLDLAMLEAVAHSGINILLVGPDAFSPAGDGARFRRLSQLPGVQWVGPVPHGAVPSYLRHIDVGLTPYADSLFNRRSHPLKTLEYLAAGIPVVTTDVADSGATDPRFVNVAADAVQFVDLVEEVLANKPDAAEVRRSVETESWDQRAARLLELLDRASR